MKKITLFGLLLFSAYVSAQETFAIYTENATIGAGVTTLRFSNGQGFAISEPTTAPFEGTKNYLFTFNGTSSYFHAIMFPRNPANTTDIAVSLANYSFYNVSIKTVSATPFYIRMRGNNVTAKVLIDPAANSYGFTNDNQWHLLSIPIADFIPESSSFNLTSITEIFVLRSNIPGSTAGTANNFEVDNIYASVEQVLDRKEAKISNFKMYPNPSSNSLTFTAAENIDQILIYNLLGQKVMQLEPKTTNVTTDISTLQNGAYLVSIQSVGKTATMKLIKK